MKKQLLFAAFLMGGFFTSNAQEVTQNFDALTIGNVGTDATGATAGEGGWYTLVDAGDGTTDNLDTTTFQFVAGNGGNVVQATGPNGDTGGAFMWLAGTDTFWADRTAGNDTFEVEYQYYTGTANSSLNRFGVYVYDESFRVLGGLVVANNNLEVLGVVFSQPQGATSPNNYIYSLGTEEEPNVILPENTWVTLKISYNYTDGATTLSVPGYIEEGTIVIGTLPEADPMEVDMVAFSGSTQTTDNAAAGTGFFDNLVMSAVGATAGTEDFMASTLAVFPNPATNVINVVNTELLTGVQIVDLNGRVVKSAKVNATEAQINISDLSAGVYMMNIATDKGTTTKKIVKN